MISSVLYRCAHGHELRTYRLAPVCGADGCHAPMIEVNTDQVILRDDRREMLAEQHQGWLTGSMAHDH